MTGHESSGEYANGQLFFDVYAMSRRCIDEAQGAQRMACEAVGQEVPQIPAGLNEIIAAASAHQLIDMMQGRPQRSMEEYIDELAQALSDDAITELIIEKSEHLADTTPAAVRELFVFASRSINSFVNPEAASEEARQIDLFEKAKELQASKGDDTTIESIFRDEASYAELIRHAYRPEEMVAKILTTTERLNPQTVAEVTLNNGLMMLKMAAESMGEELSQEDIEEFKAQATAPEFQQAMVVEAQRGRTANAHVIVKMVERFWGEGASEKLPEDIRERIQALTYSAVTTRKIGELTIVITDYESQKMAELMQKRLDFSQKYCEERGWNHADLAMEQVIEIRDQPGWKDPGQ